MSGQRWFAAWLFIEAGLVVLLVTLGAREFVFKVRGRDESGVRGQAAPWQIGSAPSHTGAGRWSW